MLRLTHWMADYYLCPWGQVLGAVVPAGVRRLAGTRQVTLLQVPSDVVKQLAQQKVSSKQQRRALEVLAQRRATAHHGSTRRRGWMLGSPYQAAAQEGSGRRFHQACRSRAVR